ncbi:MAG: histidine phosphatase family protein [Acidimicrobiia bacterium]|nr:histidine phosphatase family protein [Acidimicrobiia bacterium]
MKQLLIMRHAKSDWSAGRPDHDRPLNRRGAAAAADMGRALAAMDEAPDLVISSTARRAATTAQLAAEAGEWSAPITHSDALYGTSANGALEVLMEADPAAACVMLVGHQPTWGALVSRLTGASAAMKTATVAKVELYIRDWTDALSANGELVFLLQPRSIARLVSRD